MRAAPSPPDVSIVVPVYDEHESIGELAAGLRAIRDALPPSEVILVDDGSTDGSSPLLDALHREDPWFQVVRFSRNFGQTAALAAGFDHARGRVIVTMDADLQNDPADIPRLLAKLDEGFDVVSGWRIDRKDRYWTRRVPSGAANRLISWISKVKLHDYGCTLKAYRRDVVEELELYGDAHRFLPALAAVVGDRVAEIQVNHRPRAHGRSKYGIGRVSKVFLDLLALPFMLRFFNRPIRFFGGLGLVFGAAGTAVLGYLAYQRLALQQSIGSRPLLFAGMLLMLMGVQFVSLGLIGELVIRTYYSARGRHAYHVRRTLTGCAPGRHVCGADEQVRLREKLGGS